MGASGHSFLPQTKLIKIEVPVVNVLQRKTAPNWIVYLVYNGLSFVHNLVQLIFSKNVG